jgi:AcrR family transcriptional regulator
MTDMPRNPANTRDSIVSAAAKLFYAEGIRAVSVDAVSEMAGITKKTFYYHFRSKDELIAAYLDSRDQPTLALYARWFEATEGSLQDKVKGLFVQFAQAASTPKWKGCGFFRTIAELANTPGHPALKVGAGHKKRFEAWLTDVLVKEEVCEAADTARKIAILLDGAAAVMLIHRDPAYVEAAGEVAALLIEPFPAEAMSVGTPLPPFK